MSQTPNPKPQTSRLPSSSPIQEIDLRQPAIEVGGTALVEGVPVAMNDVLGFDVIVSKHPQYIGAVGGALLASYFR